MPPDSATLSSAVHVERAMIPHQITFCPPLAQILKETLVIIEGGHSSVNDEGVPQQDVHHHQVVQWHPG